ncbi:LPXTG cell wall anchor domain-containing protein [Arthrobacter sp. yr096]|uniref:LPXTG cell wall anchor domain-containing protein n=1 Tax=Arthrobacter sp. yr096 TaxID=1761750 RepID=UPI00210DABF6|nr:LPXTG cell wall anchor domain-containing protein [Arthrobacter sp. yr096]
MLATVVAAGTLMLGVSPAMASSGDFTISLSAPQAVPLSQNYNYTATIDFDGVDSSHPATGVAMTTTLPEGTTFAGLPTGDSSPVLSHNYEPSTRALTMTLKDTTKDLVSVVYTVSQVDNELKYEGYPLRTVMTGTGGPAGQVTSAPVTSTITGPHDYRAQKTATTITGSTHREVTYRFNVCSEESYLSFSAYAQKLSDVFPAGAEFASASTGQGTWDTSAWPQATWTNDERYDHTGYCLDRTNTGIWLTVRYPEAVVGWEDGQRPPANSVTLETTDAHGVVRAGTPAAAQGPAFTDAGGVTMAIEKSSGGQTSAGMIARSTYVNASYLGPRNSPRADDLVVTDSGAAGGLSEEWFHHNDVTAINVAFSPVLATEDLPYTIEYQTDHSDAWQTFTGAGSSTGINLALTVQTTGSSGWETFNGNNTLNLPPGSALTGWRISVAPGNESVPVSSEVRVTVGSVPVFRDITEGVLATNSPAGVAPGPVNNTATLKAGDLTGEASDVFTPLDSVYLTTNVSAPSVLSVGDSGTIRAGIVNQNPSETYKDAAMSVVLPCGVQYDPAKTITPITDLAVGVEPIPTIGNGVKVDSTQRVTDASGCELQVITFAFDQISPMRDSLEASDRRVENSGWQYDIPVTVLAKAYHPADSAIQVESYAYAGDERFVGVADGGTAEQTVAMTGYYAFFGEDIYNFDAARETVAKATGRVSINVAGGLLLDKLSSPSAEGPWSLDTTVDDAAFWQVYVNNVLPNAVTRTTFFDRLPSVATGDDFDVVLSGAVTGAPAGTTLEYSIDATDATSGTWSTDPANATAFRVVVDTLASGADFTLMIPTRVVGDPRFGETATNVLTAAGTYNGQAVQFATNQAAVNVAGSPSLGIVKKTNGTAYSSAPGAIVTKGSDVAWTYEVTNTGDIALANVAVSDAFTAGDGSKGILSPTSGDTGSLAPGDTRIFTAAGSAVEGQYHNTATATATAIDAEGTPLAQQPAPVSAESWYLTGQAGLSVVKTTNGEDVGSAPGPQLVPGSDVKWAFKVINTGNLALTDVLVVDKDSAGNTVFSDSIPTLAPGASVELSAQGKAVEGQYKNTVTASAADPNGGSDLKASDDSFYFGVVTGLSVVKTTNGEDVGSAPGPQLVPGSDVKWAFKVINTGNLALTDVLVVDKDSAGNTVFSDSIPTLAPGASVELSAQGKAVEGQYKNTVTASAADPNGGSDLKASDDSFYFGAVPGLTVAKLISTTEDGPWSENVTIGSGESVFWKISVTNTGNTVLTDVRFDDPAVGAIEPVATLAPGETASRVIEQAEVTESYVNVVAVTAMGPGGKAPSGSDSSEVIVKAVAVSPPVASTLPAPSAPPVPSTPPAASEDLPETGATGLIVSVVVALLLMTAGGLALVAGRRRKAA